MGYYTYSPSQRLHISPGCVSVGAFLPSRLSAVDPDRHAEMTRSGYLSQSVRLRKLSLS